MTNGQTLDDRLAHFGTVSEQRGESIIYQQESLNEFMIEFIFNHAAEP
jgi:hypothetical protein